MTKKIIFIVGGCTAAMLMGGMVAFFITPISKQPHQVVVNTVSSTLIVGGETYSLTLSENSSIYDAMQQLAAAGSLTFTATPYPGLGYFIESINGVANAHGFYWTLYVNGMYSLVGVSEYTLHSGDIITWKYEKK